MTRSPLPSPSSSSLLALAVALPFGARAQAPADLPFRNPDLPVEKRIDDLVGRLTLDEKVSLMIERAAPVERLGIPRFPWWNEALHGVARTGRATVFPQAIALAATWDTDLMLRVATGISDEARAMNNTWVARDKRNLYQGLVFWSPNINIVRDPRWGRGQETYGEDPFLTGAIGTAFVKGMQGTDPRYLKTVATAKHYAVHSGPESLRHTFDARVERERPARDVPAGLPRPRREREGRVGDVLLQLLPRPAGLRQRRAARQGPAEGVGLLRATSSPTAGRSSTSTRATRPGRPRPRARPWRSSPGPTSSAAPAPGRRARPTPSRPSATR